MPTDEAIYEVAARTQRAGRHKNGKGAGANCGCNLSNVKGVAAAFSDTGPILGWIPHLFGAGRRREKNMPSSKTFVERSANAPSGNRGSERRCFVKRSI